MSDIVERLRREDLDITEEAAREIERLRERVKYWNGIACEDRAEVERLRRTALFRRRRPLADFLCDEQNRIGPGCDELVLAQSLLRK